MNFHPRPIAALLIAGYLCVVFYLTVLMPFSLGEGAKLNLIPFSMMIQDIRGGGRAFVINFLGNIALFMPLGFLAPVAMGQSSTMLRIGLMGMALSASIELIQWSEGGRVADIDDVILNTFGTLVGYAIWFAALKLWEAMAARKDH